MSALSGGAQNGVRPLGATIIWSGNRRPKTAEPTSIDYPAGTPDIAGEYNRLGQLKKVTDGTGERLLEHCACGKLIEETLPAFFGSRVLAYQLEQAATGVLGRTKGYTLTAGATVEQSVTYGYDTYNRPNAVTGTPTGGIPDPVCRPSSLACLLSPAHPPVCAARFTQHFRSPTPRSGLVQSGVSRNWRMTETIFAEVFAVMFLASFFRTTFGFGEALVAVPLLALIIPLKAAAPVAVLASILIAGFVVLRDWRHIHFRSAGHLVFSTLFGLPLGLMLLKAVPETLMKVSLAVILLLFSGSSFLFRERRLSLPSDRFAWIFGFIAGICGGSYGMNGPPLAIYGALRNWPADRFRATLQCYFLPASLLGMMGFGFSGLWTGTVTRLFLWSLPAVIAGIFAGRIANKKIGARRFDGLLHSGLISIALLLLFQSLIY